MVAGSSRANFKYHPHDSPWTVPRASFARYVTDLHCIAEPSSIVQHLDAALVVSMVAVAVNGVPFGVGSIPGEERVHGLHHKTPVVPLAYCHWVISSIVSAHDAGPYNLYLHGKGRVQLLKSSLLD